MSETLHGGAGSTAGQIEPDDQQRRRERLTQLLKGCEDRDEQSLAQLYELCSAQLFGVLLRILKLESVAEDALQETFIKIWNNADRYRAAQGAPVTWMTSIARNQALDILRRRSSREDHESPQLAARVEQARDESRSPFDRDIDSEALMICLERLEAPARDCIVRAYCEGYSHEELAEVHERPLGTVKSWIRRGLLSLRGCLDEFA